MVVVLDEEATPFKRIWCSFEKTMVILGKKLKLDFATVHRGKPQLLTEGFATETEEASAAAHLANSVDNMILRFDFGAVKSFLQAKLLR